MTSQTGKSRQRDLPAAGENPAQLEKYINRSQTGFACYTQLQLEHGPRDHTAPMPPTNSLLVLSALGEDRPGIVNQLSKQVMDAGGNIVDSRMTVLGGEFAILLLVEGRWDALSKLESSIPVLEERLKLTIVVKRTQSRDTGRSMIPYVVDVIALDHPGIVHSLASFFSAREINIEDMSTSCYQAPHTGTTMFALHMTIGVPSETHIASLRDDFMEYCDSLNLDAVLEPDKR